MSGGRTNVQLYGSPIPIPGFVVVGISSLQETDPHISGFQGGVAKLDATTGAVIWRGQTVCDACNGGAVWSTPAIDLANGLVFVGSGNLYTPPADGNSDAMIAFSLADGHKVWVHQFLADDIWTQPTGGPGPDYDFGASPNLFTLNGHEVMGEGQKSGQYHVVDAFTGISIWDAKLSSGSSLGGFLGSTAYHDGAIFGGLVNDGTGQGTDPTDVQAQPTGGKVMGFSASDGAIRWFLPKVPTLSAAAASHGAIFQGDLSGTLFAFDAKTGAILWAFPTGEPIESGPSIAHGTLFGGTGSGLGVGAGHHLEAFAPAIAPPGTVNLSPR